MSKLSLENEVITSHSEVCKCGLKITRNQDKANGICRKCNPFIVETKEYKFGRVTGQEFINITGNPDFSR